MSSLLLFFIIVSAGNVVNCILYETNIIGGHDVNIMNYPYHVSVRAEGSYVCGGCIISNRVVATGAHCVDFFVKGPGNVSIQYGVSTLNSTERVITASSIKVHPLWDRNKIVYDIGLIHLSVNITFSKIAKAVPLNTIQPLFGTKAIITGWGMTSWESIQSSSVLQATIVRIQNISTCQYQYRREHLKFTAVNLCAGIKGGHVGSCNGDSGGPLTFYGKLAGITSYSLGCGSKDYAAVYANVATLAPWIRANMK